MARVTFKASGKVAVAEDGEWLYDVCERAGSGVPFACKAGACGTCATEVIEGWESLDPQGAREVRTLVAEGLDPRAHRLPCLSEVHGDVTFGTSAHAAAEAAAQEPRAGRPSFDAVVESYRPLNLTVCEVRFFVPGQPFEFRPGQYVIFNVPGGERPVRRSYSISVPPSDRGHFEVCVRAVAGGRGSNFVHALRPGDTVEVEGPFGKFYLDETSTRDIVMVATGTGMAPIKSMLMHLLDTRADRRVRLYFGLRHEGDLFYTDLLRGLKAHYPALEYHVTLSAPSAAGWAGPRGRVTRLLEEQITAVDAERSEAYLCGGRSMIGSVRELLLAKGFSKGSIKHENFY